MRKISCFAPVCESGSQPYLRLYKSPQFASTLERLFSMEKSFDLIVSVSILACFCFRIVACLNYPSFYSAFTSAFSSVGGSELYWPEGGPGVKCRLSVEAYSPRLLLASEIREPPRSPPEEWRLRSGSPLTEGKEVDLTKRPPSRLE